MLYSAMKTNTTSEGEDEQGGSVLPTFDIGSKLSELNTSQPTPYSLLIFQKNFMPQAALYQVSSDGEFYSIPRTNAGYSRIVIDLLSQVITLSKIPGSIHASPSVLIR